MKRILVMGGKRFVGKSLVKKLLEEGNDVTVANRSGTSAFAKEVHNIIFDRNDRKSISEKISKKDFDIVYDMICYSPQNARDIVENISTGKYIMISSSVVYDWGINHKEEEFDAENHPIINVGGGTIEELGKKFGYKQGYKIGKMSAEAIVMQNKSIPSICIRFPLIIGKGDHTKRMETYIESIKNKRGIYIDNLYSNVSMVGAENAANYLVQIKEKEFIGAINMCDLGSLSILELINSISSMLREDIIYDSESNIYGGYNQYYSNTFNLDRMMSVGIIPQNLEVDTVLNELI